MKVLLSLLKRNAGVTIKSVFIPFFVALSVTVSAQLNFSTQVSYPTGCGDDESKFGDLKAGPKLNLGVVHLFFEPTVLASSTFKVQTDLDQWLFVFSTGLFEAHKWVYRFISSLFYQFNGWHNGII